MSKRSNKKHPNLLKRLNTKVRQELIDYDYLEKLSPEELDWLNRFSGEYVNASFEKTSRGEYSKKNLHKSSEARKDCYNRNNWRKNDVHAVNKSLELLKSQDKLNTFLEESSVRSADEVENTLIELLDSNNEEIS